MSKNINRLGVDKIQRYIDLYYRLRSKEYLLRMHEAYVAKIR